MNIRRASRIGNSQWIKLLIVLLMVTAAWHGSSAAYIHAKASLAQYLMAHAWQQTLTGKPKVTPWPWADTWPIARLTIPSRQQSLIVMAGATGRTLAFGPGHIDGTALPGANGTSVIGGHRDTHFEFLKDLQIGEQISIQNQHGYTSHYEIHNLQVADISSDQLLVTNEENALVLVTCYPFRCNLRWRPLALSSLR